MQELEQALEEIKGLHHKVLGWSPPDLGPQTYAPFPPGVDPLKHALLELQHLKEISEQVAFAPRPGAWVPVADSLLTKDEFIVRLEVPGLPSEDLKVFIVGGECVVRGERKAPEYSAEMRPISAERPWGPFERRFQVPLDSRLDEMKARAVNGVLELRIPLSRSEAPKEKKVEVR